jgi:anti-anti-sigma regulatory factor
MPARHTWSARSADRAGGSSAAAVFDGQPVPGPLAIGQRRCESGLHIMVSGALGAVTAHELTERCDRIDPDAGTVLIDLADLADIDRGGIQALVAAYGRFGERLVILAAPWCARAIELANLPHRLPLVTDR